MTDTPEEIGERLVELLPRLRRFARSLSRNQHDADDLVQSAVERAWRHLGQFKPGASLASWTFGIMKNAWLDNLRARHRRAEVALPEDSGEHPAVSPVDTHTILWSVSEAMNKLPEDQRLAVALVLVEGMSYKEAAEVLEIPMGTLTSRLARGRTALAAALAADEDIRVKYDDETLMAYADGELDAKLRAEISTAIDNDPSLARRVEQQRALRARVASAFTKVLDEPLPDRLMVAARGKPAPASAEDRGNVLQFPARASRPPAAPWRSREWAAMAASLVLGVLLSWRMFAPSDPEIMVAGKDALVARGELANALDSQLASEQRGEEPVLIGLTFKARDGNFCRSFTMRATRTAGLACRAGTEWQVRATDSSLEAQAGMQQASSMVPPAIVQAIEAHADGEALDAQAERAAHGAGWNADPKN